MVSRGTRSWHGWSEVRERGKVVADEPREVEVGIDHVSSHEPLEELSLLLSDVEIHQRILEGTFWLSF